MFAWLSGVGLLVAGIMMLLTYLLPLLVRVGETRGVIEDERNAGEDVCVCEAKKDSRHKEIIVTCEHRCLHVQHRRVVGHR